MAPSKHVQKEDSSLESLRTTWKELYATTLPSLARARDPSQPKWPVTLDHCFARIILDNTVGSGTRQWDAVISKPAVKNMSAEQLSTAIELGNKIKDGSANLVDLDKTSLECRGKREGKHKDSDTGLRKADDQGLGKSMNSATPSKRKQQSTDTLQHEPAAKKPKQSSGNDKKQSTLSFSPSNASKPQHKLACNDIPDSSSPTSPDLTPSETLTILRRISADRTLTPFRKRLYTSLLSVPRGAYTTYAALATFLGSSARAVGNGMRNNPFAPQVPCHRVLASDGSLGGYGGDWGREGKGKKGYLPRQEEKVKLLESEGVRFDSMGRVKGRVWDGFWDGRDWERELGVKV